MLRSIEHGGRHAACACNVAGTRRVLSISRSARSSVQGTTVFGLVLAACLAGSAIADDAPAGLAEAFEASLVEAIARSERSVVSISRIAKRSLPDNRPDLFAPNRGLEPEPNFVAREFGSGVIIAGEPGTDERFVLTAAHVAFGRRTFTGTAVVTNLTKPSLKCDSPLGTRSSRRSSRRTRGVIWRCCAYRWSSRRIPLEAAPPIEFGDGAPLSKGRLVIALGNPYAIARDGSASASVGIVSNLSRRPWPPRGVLVDPTEEDLTIHHYGTLLQVDTRLNFGTSGGALLDRSGRLVGLTTSLAALEGYEKSVGYAVPMDRAAQKIIVSLRQGYEVEYGFLGIQPGTADGEQLTPFRHLTTQASAARVRRVAPLSPADGGGLQPGDIVLAVEETPVYSDIDLIREIGWLGPDAIANLTVLRPDGGQVLTLACRLGKWPVYDESLSITTRERHPVWRGLHLDYPTARKRYLSANPLLSFPQGVVITRVDPGSRADEAGLREGDFILSAEGRSLLSPADFAAAVTDPTSAVTLELADDRTVTIAADVEL